ncbi:MAG: isoprenylcysteine carboxylmethyltransferase family protein [Bacteroidota bacterium]|nr:isoprenylcysteine carboxylmethyltransferase family protein [Bacteroidota bacterium]
MALVHEFERSGNWLFKRRSWLPVFIVAAGITAMYLTNRQAILFDPVKELVFLGISLAGEALRVLTVGFAPRNTSGRNTTAGQVAEDLNTTGAYSILRHPLYLGNLIMWLGPILFVRSSVFIILFFPVYWLYYERIMFAEEQFLRTRFGDAYDKWSEKVNAFIPGFREYIKPALPFSFRNVLKREYNSFINIFLIFVLLDLLRNYFLSERIYLTPMWMWISIPAGVIWTAVRIIHKKTSWLEVPGR